jgi:hypothetical protein
VLARPWIFDWLQENGIDTDEGAAKVFTDRRLFKNFQFAAQQVGVAKLGEQDPPPGIAILAGRGIDLTGDLVCSNGACLRNQVDTLLRHVWHYFDYIYIHDLTGEIAEASFKRLNKDFATGWLRSIVYLLNVGASDMVYLVHKEGNCKDCLEGKARSVGLGSLIDEETELVDDLVRRSHLWMDPKNMGTYREISIHTTGIAGSFNERRAATWIKSRQPDEVLRQLASDYLKSAIRGLTSDIRSARLARAPLGATVEYYNELITRTNVSPEASLSDQIAFNLQVPVLENVPLKTIFALKQADGDIFQNFQAKLRVAVHEKAKTVGAADAKRAAKEIEEDLIEPQLAEIRATLSKNSSSLSRTFSSVLIGGALMTAGLLFKEPAAATAGGITASAGLSNALRGFQDRDTLQTRDMYFLFKAAEHAETHNSLDDRFRFVMDTH